MARSGDMECGPIILSTVVLPIAIIIMITMIDKSAVETQLSIEEKISNVVRRELSGVLTFGISVKYTHICKWAAGVRLPLYFIYSIVVNYV